MSSWLLIEGANVIDGSGSSPVLGSVLTRDDSIAAVGDAQELLVQVPRGEEVTRLEATGCTVMPGLIDAHCHMTFGEARTEEEIDLYTSVELRTLVAANNLQKVLRAGVTSISDAGGTFYVGVALREAVESGMIPGPRIFPAARMIATNNWYYPDSVGWPAGGIQVFANSLDQMLSEVRSQVHNGVDLIKLADSNFGEYQAFRDDELKQIAELVHQLGRKVTIHARGSAEVGASARAGLDWIMHGSFMSDEVIETLAESRIPLVPTMLLSANIAEWGDRCGASTSSRDHRMRALERTAATLQRAREAGVKLLAGTDTGFAITPYGEWHAREMELLSTYAGLSPLEAIKAMTKDAAQTVNLEGKVGEIKPGQLADLIVVQGDPSRNLRILLEKSNIKTVVKDGRVLEFDEEALARCFSNKRSIAYSTSDLRFRDIYGDGAEAEPSPDEGEPTQGLDLDLAHEIVDAGKRVREQAGTGLG